MAAKPQKIKTTNCPQCTKETVLLWIHINSPSLPPLCKNCFTDRLDTNLIKQHQYRLPTYHLFLIKMAIGDYHQPGFTISMTCSTISKNA
jgi:hypothetical protein